MRKTILGLGMLAVIALAAPRAADAGVSISIGLPGFVVGGPVYGPPVVYGPRAYYAPRVYAPYYRPYYRSRAYYGYGRHHHGYDRDCHRGRYRHYDRRYRYDD